MYQLPANLKTELREPLGKLIQDTDLAKYNRSDTWISVGDMSTVTLVKKGIPIKLAIVDYKTKREDYSRYKRILTKVGKRVIKVVNPSGVITSQLWAAIETAINSSDNVRIEVDGEEDLATLPCVHFAAPHTKIVYGLPGKGLIIVDVDDIAKKKVETILTLMK